MRALADHDVIGDVVALRRILQFGEWSEYLESLDIEFLDFEVLGLPVDAPDREVWSMCQVIGAVLITGNRSGGPGSLEDVLRELGTLTSLPVLTIANRPRLAIDGDYARAAAVRLLDYLDGIESLRGTGRLFLP